MCNLAKVISIQLLIGYFIIGVPLGALLAFEFQMDLVGLQLGFMASYVFLLITSVFTIRFVDLQAKADEASARMDKEKETFSTSDTKLHQKQT